MLWCLGAVWWGYVSSEGIGLPLSDHHSLFVGVLNWVVIDFLLGGVGNGGLVFVHVFEFVKGFLAVLDGLLCVVVLFIVPFGGKALGSLLVG
jgi:hypothetical protein